MTRYEVCERSALPEGERIVTEVGGRNVGVINHEGELYAIENECAHQGGPVCTGKVQGAVTGEHVGIGERVREFFDEDSPSIACPWHGWEYDLETGRHLGDDRFGIQTYSVVEEDGLVYVEL